MHLGDDEDVPEQDDGEESALLVSPIIEEDLPSSSSHSQIQELLGATPRDGGDGGDDPGMCRGYMRRCREQWRILIATLLYVGVASVKSSILFPFYRTLVSCPPGTPGLNLTSLRLNQMNASNPQVMR